MKRDEKACAFLADKDRDPADLQEELSVSPQVYATTLVAVLASDNKRAKNRAVKLLAVLAGEYPKAVYPHAPLLIEYLTGTETILLWNALIALGHLAAVDRKMHLEAVLPALIRLLGDDSMITAGHAITCLGRIAAAKPSLRTSLVKTLLAPSTVSRDPECAGILAGKTLVVFATLSPPADKNELILMRQFAREHLQSPRTATRTLATTWSKRLEHMPGE